MPETNILENESRNRSIIVFRINSYYLIPDIWERRHFSDRSYGLREKSNLLFILYINGQNNHLVYFIK